MKRYKPGTQRGILNRLWSFFRRPAVVLVCQLSEDLYDRVRADVVLQTISSIWGRPLDTLPLDWLLGRDLGIDSLERRAILSAIESQLQYPVLDGLHGKSDFTSRDVLETYARE